MEMCTQNSLWLYFTTTFVIGLLLVRFYIYHPSFGRKINRSSKGSNVMSTKQRIYTNVFPPSLRSNLARMTASLPRTICEELGELRFDQTTFERSLLAFDENCFEADNNKYVYSGFSVKEIKALGNFPDYASLTGVPLPRPWLEFNIDNAVSRPYRPLRWPYHQTMALTKLEPDFWIDIDGTYKDHMARRKRMFAESGHECLSYLPGSELAVKEALEMTIQFLCNRFPQYFSLSEDRTVLHNRLLGTSDPIYNRHPLLVLLEHVPEDFAFAIRNPATGKYHARAGLSFSSLGWTQARKIGKSLSELHEPVPDYKEKMELSMDRFFSSMPADKPIQRGSWGIEIDDPYFMPPGHPHEKYRDFQLEGLSEDRLMFRVDWQRLRRLPLSGALLFVNRPVFTPLTRFREEPYIPSLCLKILEAGKGNLMEYKGTWHIQHVAIPMLKRYEKEQKQKGMIPADWEPVTLLEQPFFPQALENWHSTQGF